MNFEPASDSPAINAIRNAAALEIESRIYLLCGDLANLGKFQLNPKYLRLFEDGRHSDVLMRIGTGGGDRDRIECHSAMICTASPVFDADLTHEVQERQKREIAVADFDFPTMRMLIRYCYVESVPEDYRNP